MGNIDYSKAEKEVEKAVQDIRVKNLVEGKPITSSQAIRYYALEDESVRPSPQDNVEKLISETAATEEDEGKEKEAPAAVPVAPGEAIPIEEETEEEEEFEIFEEIPTSDVLKKARKQSPRVPKKRPAPAKGLPPAEKFLEKASPLLILRKHIFWLKQLHIDDRYERLGTTKEEVFALRKARRLSDADLKRVRELNLRAEKLKKELLEEKGTASLDEIVEHEQKRHKRKRFNTRETWLQL